MTFDAFKSAIAASRTPVILLEGRRSISDEAANKARALGRQLALDYPELRFRSGNAVGSDQAFSEGVASIDASRLQIVAPYHTHRSGSRFLYAIYDSPESMSHIQEADVAYKTISATPKNKRLIEKRTEQGQLAAKAAYLIRDTMKVVGHCDQFAAPLFALFHVDLKDPEAGGTGHTIRVCRQEHIPYAFQDVWHTWIR